MKEYVVKRPIKRPPVHPGTLLKTDVLPSLEISVVELSNQLKISRQQVYRILAGKQPINAYIALKLARLTGVSANLLMSMQQSYDLWHAEEDIADELEQIQSSSLREPLSGYGSRKSPDQSRNVTRKFLGKKRGSVKKKK
jgi:addiction module HigA family antidote